MAGTFSREGAQSRLAEPGVERGASLPCARAAAAVGAPSCAPEPGPPTYRGFASIGDIAAAVARVRASLTRAA